VNEEEKYSREYLFCLMHCSKLFLRKQFIFFHHCQTVFLVLLYFFAQLFFPIF